MYACSFCYCEWLMCTVNKCLSKNTWIPFTFQPLPINHMPLLCITPFQISEKSLLNKLNLTLHTSLLFDLCWITEVRSARTGFHDFKFTCWPAVVFSIRTSSLISDLIVMTFKRKLKAVYSNYWLLFCSWSQFPLTHSHTFKHRGL